MNKNPEENSDKSNLNKSTSEQNLSETQHQSKNQQDVTLLDIVNVVAERVDPLIKLVETFAQKSLSTREVDAGFRKHMAWVAVTIVTLIVVAASVLTFIDKLDGSTYGFLLGLIVGYVLTFIRDAIQPRDLE
jgi:hypothetical protein